MRQRKNGFISYAHDDLKYVLELQKHLRHHIRNGELNVWCDTDIKVGDEWRKKISRNIDSASFAILFVSVSFKESNFIAEHELPPLLNAAEQDGLLILAVLTSTCLIPDELKRYQFVDGINKPLADKKPGDRHKVYTKVLQRVLEHLRSQDIESPTPIPALTIHNQANLGALAPLTAHDPAQRYVLDSIVQRGVELAKSLSEEIVRRLENIRYTYLTGSEVQALVEIRNLMEHQRWADFTQETQGKIIRTAALYIFQTERDEEQARELAERAKIVDPNGDDTILGAMMAYAKGKRDVALAILGKGDSLKTCHLKAGIEIDANKAEVALVTLSNLPDGTIPDPETHRLRAMAYLSTRNLPRALESIEDAQKGGSDWHVVREARAIVGFWQACTPAALELTTNPLCPSPFPPSLVRADDAARGYLRESAAEFERLAQREPIKSKHKNRLLTWQMLCLLVGGEERPQVAILFEQILDCNATDIWPILWAFEYQLEFDRERVKAALLVVPEDANSFVDCRGIYYGFEIDDGNAEKILADLANIRELFESRLRVQAWHHWKIQALFALGRTVEAEHEIQDVTDHKARSAYYRHLQQLQIRTGNAVSPPAVDAPALIDESDALTLLHSCQLQARQGDWVFAGPVVNRLLRSIPTPEIVSLLTQAAWNAGKPGNCIRILDEYRFVFPSSSLPIDLSVLRVRCQRALGQVNEAIENAHANFEENPEPYTLIELLDVQAQQGDLQGIQESARRFLGMNSATGEQLLRVAGISQLVDRELAILLWRQAVATGSTQPDWHIQAYLIGEALGLGQETAPMLKTAIEFAGKGEGSMVNIPISEMAEKFEEWKRSLEERKKLYQSATMPVHMMPKGTLRPLSVLFHQIPEQNRINPDPILQDPVLIRHGARPLQRLSKRELPKGRLYLDITALLVAADLDILAMIEKAFTPLYIPEYCQAYLLEEIRGLRPNQPKRLQARKNVERIIRDVGIKLVDIDDRLNKIDQGLASLVGERNALELAYVRANNGTLIEFLPFHGTDLKDYHVVSLPVDWKPWVASPRALAKLAKQKGWIDAKEYAHADEFLQAEHSDDDKFPIPGTVMLISSFIAELIEEAGLLGTLSRRFSLQMPRDDWKRDQAELDRWKSEDQLADWVQKLIDKINQGMRRGAYTTIPKTPRLHASLTGEAYGLEDILNVSGTPNDIVWIDDRFLNGYPGTGNCRLYGVVEILDLLRAKDSIKEPERYRLLNRLRAGNYKFIPFDKGEILYWLEQGHGSAGQFVAPQELLVLRQYWAACLYQGAMLQRPPAGPQNQGEIAFIIATRSAIDDAIVDIWNKKTLNLNRKRQRVQWILDNLYTGFINFSHLLPDSPQENHAQLIGFEIASLLMMASRINIVRPKGQKGQHSVFKLCMEWLKEALIEPRLQADPKCVSSAAAQMCHFFTEMANETKSEQQAHSFGIWVLNFLHELPPLLREEIHRNDILMGRLGLAHHMVIEVDGHHYDYSKFWEAVAQAMAGKEARLLSENGKEAVIHIENDDTHKISTLVLSYAKSTTQWKGYFEFSEILSRTEAERLAVLQQHPEWWDGETDQLEAIQRRLAAIDIPSERMSILQRMAESSAADHYQKTAARLSITRSLPVDLFRPPNMNAILRYLRLDSISFIEANDLAETWEQMGESLLVSLDLHEAIKRACCLPVPLPECLLNRISMLTEKDAGVLLQRLQLDLLSPISRLHFVDISLELAPKYEFAVDFADKQIIHLLSEQADKEFNLMLAICSFSYREFDNLKVENTEWPTQLLTAWIHSVKLANLLLRYSFNYSELADWISLLSPMPLQNFFLRNWHANRDLAWHANTSFTEIIFVGLARVLTRHEQCHDKLKPLDEFRDRIKSVHTSLLINPRDIFLLHNPYLFTDDLECLWGGERSKLFKILLPPEIAHQFSESSYSASIDEELANLNENPYYENSWMLLHCIARNARLDKNRAEKLDLVLEKLNLTELLKQYPMQLRIILDILIPNVNFIDKIEEFLLSWALRLDFTDTTESTSDLIEADAQEEISMTQVVEWAFQLAVRKSEDEEINDFEFARLLQGLMAKSKRFSAWINKPLLLLSRHISYNHHHELHRLVLCARSRPEAPSR